MSDKSRDAEQGDAFDANDEGNEPGQENRDDAVIADLERDLTPEEQDAAEADEAPAQITRRTAKAPVRKGAPTRKRNAAAPADEHDPYAAKNPAEFVGQSVGELKKVVWPTWPQLVVMFSAVLVFVLIMIAIVGLLDMGFGWALLRIFGSN